LLNHGRQKIHAVKLLTNLGEQLPVKIADYGIFSDCCAITIMIHHRMTQTCSDVFGVRTPVIHRAGLSSVAGECKINKSVINVIYAINRLKCKIR